MDRGAWWATVHRAAKSRTRLKWLSMYILLNILLFSCSVVSDSLLPHGLQHTRLPCPSLSPRVWSNSCSLSWWCHPTISSSVACFSSCLQSFPPSGSFLMSWLFASGPKYWSFSVSIIPSNEFSGLISFRIDKKLFQLGNFIKIKVFHEWGLVQPCPVSAFPA